MTIRQVEGTRRLLRRFRQLTQVAARTRDCEVHDSCSDMPLWVSDYTITATPAGVMAGDVCGPLSVNETGAANVYTCGWGTQEICWNR